MALLDTTQAMYGGVSSGYLIQNGYARNSSYYREYEQDALARLNLQQRLASSPEQHYDLHARLLVKEERLGSLPPSLESYSPSPTAFKPYSSPGQENLPLPHHVNQQTKVRSRSSLTPATSRAEPACQVWEVIHHWQMMMTPEFDESVISQMMMSSLTTATHFSRNYFLSLSPCISSVFLLWSK